MNVKITSDDVKNKNLASSSKLPSHQDTKQPSSSLASPTAPYTSLSKGTWISQTALFCPQHDIIYIQICIHASEVGLLRHWPLTSSKNKQDILKALTPHLGFLFDISFHCFGHFGTDYIMFLEVQWSGLLFPRDSFYFGMNNSPGFTSWSMSFSIWIRWGVLLASTTLLNNQMNESVLSREQGATPYIST